MLRQLVDIDVIEMARPDDASGLEELLKGSCEAADIVAIIGKTEGTGLGKDPARETADRAIKSVLAKHLGVAVEQVEDKVCMVLSGGCPGVITPHIAVITRRYVDEPAPSDGVSRLVIGLAHSEPIEPFEIGRTGQIDKVAAAVRDALEKAGIDDPTMVHAVLVKGPALTEAGIEAAVQRGFDTVTRDLGIGPEGAMCFANDGSALGIAVALGEVDRDALSDDVVRSDFSLYSDVAFTSSGGEKTRAEVLVLANSPAGVGSLRIGHSSMRSIIDLAAVQRALDSAASDGQPHQGTTPGLVYLMCKMIIPDATELNGHHITLHDDPVGYHVAKAMGGYLLASTTGMTCCFVSGGERNSHQGPPDGNPLAAIVRLEQQLS